MSRGAGFSAPADAPITGEVALVTADHSSIFAGRELGGQLLAKVDKGMSIVVTGQTDAYWAVAMSNRTLGFIAKSDAQLLGVQITENGASGASGAQTGYPNRDGNGLTSRSGFDRSQEYAAVVTGTPLAKRILQSAYNLMGVVPYVYGGDSTAGIDCSAFVQTVYGQNGVTLPRTAAQQAKVGTDVSLYDVSQWLPGDRLYFRCHHDYIDHTAIYMGNGYFIHSSIDHRGVAIDPVSSPYYWAHLVAVRRSPEVGDAIGESAPQVGSPDFEADQE